MDYIQKKIPIKKIKLNVGQIEGLPKNPRFIKDERFKALKKSIEDAPEMLELRELLVYPFEEDYVVIAGNMRLRASKELGFTELPCKVLDPETPVEKLREYTIKDNIAFGEDDKTLLLEWDAESLQGWGMEFSGIKDTERLSDVAFKGMYYEPSEIPEIRLENCVDMSLYEKKISALDKFELTPEQRDVLRLFAYRFIKIDYERVASYYAFCASEEEKRAIERLRLVLVDGAIDGFIEDDLLRIHEIVGVDDMMGGDE